MKFQLRILVYKSTSNTLEYKTYLHLLGAFRQNNKGDFWSKNSWVLSDFLQRLGLFPRSDFPTLLRRQNMTKHLYLFRILCPPWLLLDNLSFLRCWSIFAMNWRPQSSWPAMNSLAFWFSHEGPLTNWFWLTFLECFPLFYSLFLF